MTEITATAVKGETLSSNIENMDDGTLVKYIKRALTMIGAYVDLDQFLNDDNEYDYPSDMLQAVTYIVEYMYIDQGMFWSGPSSFKSEKIGNYSYTKKGGKDVLNGTLDLPTNILTILDKYRTRADSSDMTIGGYDRDYLDDSDLT